LDESNPLQLENSSETMDSLRHDDPVPSSRIAQAAIVVRSFPSRAFWTGAREFAPIGSDCVAILSFVIFVLVLAITLVAAIGSPLKDDIAWLLHLAGDLLDGKRLYVDDVEINPPLIVWLLLVPAKIARASGVPVKIVADVSFAGVIIAAAFWSARLLRGYNALFEHQTAIFTAIATVLLIVPGVEFGQREHLLITLALPYLCLVALRLSGRARGKAEAVGAGIAAAVGCALKPDYGIAFAGLELMAMSRGLGIWRPETLCATSLLAGYAAAVVVFFPTYLGFIVPLAHDLYGASDVSFGRLLIESHNLLLGQSILLLLCLTRRARGDPLMIALAIFASGAILACFIEQKDWFYHRLPATIAVVLGLAYWIADVLFDHGSSGA
jgi:hypothetical protein